MRGIIRKADIVLLIVLAAVGIALALFSMRGTVGQKVVVSVNGKEYGVYSLDVDREVTIEHDGHINKFSISAGEVQMTEASCPNHDCIHMGKISKTNQTIVCLPNRVSITIEGGESDVDVIAD